MAGLSCINRSSPIDTRLAAEHTSLSLSNTMREIPPLTCVKEDYANLLPSIVCFFCTKRAGRFRRSGSLRRESFESARGRIRNPLCGEDS